MNVPDDVVTWVKEVFRACDVRVTEKVNNVPNAPEESLDLTWIEHVSRFSSPVVLASNWTVKLETHFLGGLRHWGRWEIADIGVILFIRSGGRVQSSKVALLQSKRLYPTNQQVREEHVIDYRTGFARLADPEDLARAVATESDFEFDEDCRYSALAAGSDQVRAIEEHERERELRVYYHLYNPASVPITIRVPLSGFVACAAQPTLGTRVLPSKFVHDILNGKAKGASPSLRDFEGFSTKYGWPLADFIGDEFLGCREGDAFENISDDRIQSLFYRRSGPISAAIAITVDAPEGSE